MSAAGEGSADANPEGRGDARLPGGRHAAVATD
jgi:hypothetical protein